MSITVTTDSINIVAVNIRPTYGTQYKGDFVKRGSYSKNSFTFSSSTRGGNFTAFGESFNFFVHGAEEDYLRRLKEENGQKNAGKETKNGANIAGNTAQYSGGLSLKAIIWIGFIIVILYMFREEIYQNRHEIAEFFISAILIGKDIIKSFFDFLFLLAQEFLV